MTDLILVADNEPDILRFVEVNLRLEGFDVVVATDGQAALDIAFEQRPALVLLDVMMPRIDGFEVCRRLRNDPRTSQMPVIILTAKSLTLDKVVGLSAGADDYVLKPFDPVELVARVQTTLRRTHELRGSSPLTGLPGNHRIGQEIARCLADGAPLAVVYADLNDFKSYNDRYGFIRGDEVITMTAEILREVLDRYALGYHFMGHIGGDDFMLLCHPDSVEPVCTAIIAEFDRRVADWYDPDDRERGYLEVIDRQGEARRFPMVSMALGVASTEKRLFLDHRGMVEVATEMKGFVKRSQHGSGWAIDERRTDDHQAEPVDDGQGYFVPAPPGVTRR